MTQEPKGIWVLLYDNEALALHALLHQPEGLRESAAQQLLARHTAPEVQAWTEGVIALGRVARAVTLSLESRGLLDSASREQEIRRMALAHVRAISLPPKRNRD